MPTTRLALVALLAAGCVPAPALAQTPDRPQVGVQRLSAPNPDGWHNSATAFVFICAPGVVCPAEALLREDGIHRLEYPLIDQEGLDDPYVIRIDRTAPTVRVSLPERTETAAAAIDVVAEVADALSGVTRAACNGVAAAVEPNGRVRCRVPLLPGVNDVVVDASDAAGNSGSAGARVVRTGRAQAIRVFPQQLAIRVGNTARLQVLDDFHRELSAVEWFVDGTDVVETAPEGPGLVRGLAPGTATVTATAGELTATTVVTVYEGAEPPPQTVRWKAGHFSVVELPPLPPAPPGPRHGPISSADEAPGAHATLWTQTERTGLVEWIEVPAVADSEHPRHLARAGAGGSLLVVEDADGGWSLVRGGPTPEVRPWRYRSSGRLGAELVVDATGKTIALETPASGFPELVILDREGRVLRREPLPTGRRVERRLDCVEGRALAERQPAEIGKPTIHPGGTVTFEYAIGAEVFDACDGRLTEQRRDVRLVHLQAGGIAQHLLHEDNAAPDGLLPAVDLLPALAAGDGALLAPWRLTPADGGPAEAHVTRIAPDGITEDFPLPAVGTLFACPDELVATTDGTTLLVFNGRTGAVRWAQQPPGGNIAILAVHGGTLLHRQGGTTSERAIAGR